MGLRQLKGSWKEPLTKGIEFTVTILVYNWIKDFPPELDNQLMDSLFSIGTILISACASALVFNFVLGLPRVQVMWIVGQEPPVSNRPEITSPKAVISFRYRFESDTWLAGWFLKQTHKYILEAEIRFSPVENLSVANQLCGPETTVANSCITTRFDNGITAGNGADGEISLRRNQRRKISTPVDCTLSIRPTAAFRGKRSARMLSRLFLTDASIQGFVLKGGS